MNEAIKSKLIIRPVNLKDIPSLIKIHLSSFDEDHFSTKFNEGMLIDYFRTLISYNNHSYVASDESTNEIFGFIIAGDKTKSAIDTFVRNNRWDVLKILLKNPKFIFEKIVEIFSNLFDYPASSKTLIRLFIIAVAQNQKGKGIGKSLVNGFEKKLIDCGYSEYGLSVRKTNTKAIYFYSKNNYLRYYENRKSIFFIKYLK
ncbi:MAG TPA: GNAT family N-acetyltransferase [Ignavibacteriaceae bacterium]|nr:GNAT family N-acetyltransferase [Ignavibacteriaceae bacterium]